MAKEQAGKVDPEERNAPGEALEAFLDRASKEMGEGAEGAADLLRYPGEPAP